MLRYRIVPVLASLLATPLLVVAPAFAAPRAVAVAPIKNFDVVAKGEVIKHAFTIKNDGDTTLELTDVRPACGCTVARYDKQIAPGAEGTVRADLDTLGFEGPIAKSIAVYTNDPETPRINLVMKAEVRPYVGADPGYARFNYVQGEQTGVITQTIWAPDGTDLEIVGVENPYSHVTVTKRAATDDEKIGEKRGKQWRLDIEIQADAPVGALRDYILVEVDHPKQQKLQIPVSGFVRPRQHATPRTVDFGEITGANLPYERAIAFTSFITRGIELTKVDSSIAGLEAEVTPMDDTGHRFQVLLRMTPGAAPGAFEGKIVIHHTDGSTKPFEVPVKGRVL